MFDTNSNFQNHQVNNNYQKLSCDKWQEQTTQEQPSVIHLKEYKKYKCNTCSDCFSTKKKALEHARLGHNLSGPEPQLQCEECGKLFISKALLKAHIIQHKGGNSFVCEKCKVAFKYRRNFNSHLQTNEHLQGEELKSLLACKECSKMFTNKNNLRVHVHRVHKKGLKEHSCTYCSYKTKLLNNFKRHISLHIEKPQFMCDVCGMQLQSKQSLQDHYTRLHLNCRNFSCDKCGGMFKSSSDLKKHLTITHSDKAKHICQCGSKYKSLYSLQRHQLISHTAVITKQAQVKVVSSTGKNNVHKKNVKKPKCHKALTKVEMLKASKCVPPLLSSTTNTKTNTAVTTTKKAASQVEILPYNIDLVRNKSQVLYVQNVDMNSLHVVESVIQLDTGSENITEEDSEVLLSVKNLSPLADDYILSGPLLESPVVNELGESLNVPTHKEDVILGVQQFIMSNDLNFLNMQ